MRCCEATSAVLFDLKSFNLINQTQLKKTVNYIQICYHEKGNKGYFLSKPQISQTPHIYATFLSIRTLHTVGGCLTQKQKNLLEIGLLLLNQPIRNGDKLLTA